MKPTLDITSHFWRRLLAYSNERFPLLSHGLLIISYYSSNQFLAHVLYHQSAVHYDLSSLAGAITLFCIFLHLRVFDEHKDYIDDCKHYPQRILQRGLITLKHLKIIGTIAILLEIILSLSNGLAAFSAWAIVFCFSILMLKEFFCPQYLQQRFLLYASSHMLIMPLLALMIFSFATHLFPWQAPGLFFLYAFVGFFVGFNWEVSRKIRAPEQEIAGVDSYTKLFGTYGAAYVVLGLRLVDTVLVAIVGYSLNLSWWFYALLIVLYGVCIIGFLQYYFNTCAKTAKMMATYAGIYMIAFDILMALSITLHYGIKL